MQPINTTTNTPYYHHQQPPYQTPDPITNPTIYAPQPPYPASSASAPPLSSSYASPDYHNYPHFPDHTISSSPTAPSFPSPQFNFDDVPCYGHTPSYAPPFYSVPAPPSYDGASVNSDLWVGHDGQRYSDSADDGVYRYEGGKVEPYGARGTSGFTNPSSGLGSGSQVMFDDYGRPISVGNGAGAGTGGGYGGGQAGKMLKAAPKDDAQEDDFHGGVQKFRVKLLSEGYGQSELDVLCQVGLDGIRMLDPATSKTLRIYPFETVTKWEVLDSYIFAFWAKMPVDVEPKRIRLKSSSYTTNTILDIVTAASVQLKEIGERKVPDSSKTVEQIAEKKKGFDWMNLVKPIPIEEKDHWVPDEAVNKCSSCGVNFNAFVRRHHCRSCGEIFCDKCTQGRTPLTSDEQAPPVRVCDRCMGEVTQRLEITREAANRGGALLSHEDLAKKLKDEMSKNSKASSGQKYAESKTQKREVACPTCTVHLQVEVPSSGSETIECSVCQHPFLVSAHG